MHKRLKGGIMSDKSKLVELSVVELIAAASGRVVTGIDPVGNEDKVSNTLKSMNGYEYDSEKSLADNIYAAFPQYKLKEVTEEFSALMQKWINDGDNLTCIDNSKNAEAMAAIAGIPKTLHVKVKKEDEKAQEVAKKVEPKFTYKESSYASISDWKHRDFFK